MKGDQRQFKRVRKELEEILQWLGREAFRAALESGDWTNYVSGKGFFLTGNIKADLGDLAFDYWSNIYGKEFLRFFKGLPGALKKHKDIKHFNLIEADKEPYRIFEKVFISFHGKPKLRPDRKWLKVSKDPFITFNDQIYPCLFMN